MANGGVAPPDQRTSRRSSSEAFRLARTSSPPCRRISSRRSSWAVSCWTWSRLTTWERWTWRNRSASRRDSSSPRLTCRRNTPAAQGPGCEREAGALDGPGRLRDLHPRSHPLQHLVEAGAAERLEQVVDRAELEGGDGEPVVRGGEDD